MEFAFNGGYLFKSGAALVFIIVLVNVLLKKLHTFSGKQEGTIRIIERTPVSKSSSLAVVKVAKQYYLMSLTDSGSELLKEFSQQEAKEFMENTSSQPTKWKKEKAAKLHLGDFRSKYSEMFEKRT